MLSKPLIEHLETYLPFEEDEKALIESKVSRRTVKRKEKILQMGEICRYYTFVVSGSFRMYITDAGGKEHNILFAAEGDWISDIGSFHTEKVSESEIQAIENAEIIQIQQQDLYHLYVHLEKLNRILRVIIEDKYVEIQNRVFENISSTAQQRYLSFLKQYPKLANRLPNTQIASYLGITPEFLSMIRKELVTRK
ncbi:Crp/Fnr family transcriptional regulator [Muricauda sp. CAU 1633]|uniref:Crp/Fnr family transcriptional regulator n=1 Tax=Allomuricauda sp. CAU 1633 TaxID=2816036 RepID=UPI001A8DA8C9|nr:Crp/Fnr family transcriptional regulator [Muricauda sp. CAU 1633]MBO0322891.1 Crp/Fnr family transcriptional regulator [Muricauda sp. CAU 1633]